MLLVGVVEVSDELGLRAPELLPVVAVVAGTVLRANVTSLAFVPPPESLPTRGTHKVPEAAVATTEVENVLEVEVVMSNWGD